MNNGIYNNIETAKNGNQIPILNNNRSVESRYNPELEAEKICNSIETKYDFFLILGLASGLLADKISKKYPDAIVVCFELFEQDFLFLKQLKLVEELSQNNHIIFANLSDIYSVLINNYLPAKHGDIKVIEQRAWVNENLNSMPKIKTEIEKALKIISADYSVQTHFGKIWQTNIFNNIKLMSKIKTSVLNPDLNKTAAIIAAGPSLDITVSELKQNRLNYFIISTDTAYSTLLKNNIYPDIVISIDGQSVSYNHFFSKQIENTFFLFDLCSSFSAAKHILDQNGKIIYFTSGHPLSSLINISLNNKLPYIFTGSGTVTIAATDLAYQLGFSKINVFGADFSYSNGKTYTKGTYLDEIYNQISHKADSTEKLFDKLMYRTKLFNINQKKYTTEVLDAYKYSFEKYLIEKKIKIQKTQPYYQLTSENNNSFHSQSLVNIDYNNIFQFILNNKDLDIALLPYIAWLRHSKKISDYDELLKLAKTSISSYNIYYE